MTRHASTRQVTTRDIAAGGRPAWRFPASVAAGLAGALIGWLGTGFVAPANFRIAEGMLAALDPRAIGAAIFLVLGVAAALRVYGRGRAGRSLVLPAGLAIAVAGAVFYGVAAARETLLDTLGVNPLAPVAEIEIRLPQGSRPLLRDDIQVELHTDRNQSIVNVTDMTQSDGRTVLRANAALVFRTVQRQIVMTLPGEPVRVMPLRLAADPAPSDFGPWQQMTPLGAPASGGGTADDYAVRYRVN